MTGPPCVEHCVRGSDAPGGEMKRKLGRKQIILCKKFSDIHGV